MILVFGKTGQVATELQKLAPAARFLDSAEANLTDPMACAHWITALKPATVINAAAYTAVDKAEDDEETARLVNGASPIAMAAACAELDIPFVHISTDYVFDGSGKSPFKPDDPTTPLGTYGRTQLEGENGVRLAGGRSVILRTSWVSSANGNNFLKTMLRLGAQRQTLSIVADQVGGPTPARDIADACLEIALQLRHNREKAGTYHFTGATNVSWADFGRAIFEHVGLPCTVIDVPSSDYPTPAKRPANSRLDCDLTQKAFDIQRPDWRSAIISIDNQLKELR